MTENEIISYQFAERIKSALIIGSKMLLVLEALKDSELEGAKKVILAFFDALYTEAALARNATGMQEFKQVGEKVQLVKKRIEDGDIRDEAHAILGSAVTHATTACANTMSVLMGKGLI